MDFGFSLEIRFPLSCSALSHTIKYRNVLMFFFDLDCFIIWAMQLTNTKIYIHLPLLSQIVFTVLWNFILFSEVLLSPALTPTPPPPKKNRLPVVLCNVHKNFDYFKVSVVRWACFSYVGKIQDDRDFAVSRPPQIFPTNETMSRRHPR